MLISFICLWLWLKLNIKEALYTLLGIFVAMCIWQVLCRPYVHAIDNAGIIVNMLISVFFLIIVFLENSKIM